ncbi:F-box-like/WD repeat-containing protein TBL1XR1 [Xenia sp. Carnegie-2017]|uniref:F-box-like/WD repeat-containing protein TBL1XR1 n=1 Tax=Xenia sp. Carnegie-2017 TaxID=2897299 RepID=UPI001F04FC4F|nr:F-box-like/WD repeat-containing protein TBL1XR1 [Xenia sp. Carnegie-2017]
MAINSDEINFLVYRYLQESGFPHSAFSFGIESNSVHSSIDGVSVPSGALVSVIQKGVQFVEAEACFGEDGTFFGEGELSLIDAVKPSAISDLHARALRHLEEKAKDTLSYVDVTTGPEFPSSKVTNLEGHKSEVCLCSWNPHFDILASGAGDSTVRLWPFKNTDETKDVTSLVLSPEDKNTVSNGLASGKDVTALEWNNDGTLLATGFYNGDVKIWNNEGKDVALFKEHKGLVFCVKWNDKSSYLVTSAIDQICIVWETATWQMKQQFSLHKGPALDIDWQNSNVFASCSTDKAIHVCKVGAEKPLKTFEGHTGEINVIRWDPSGSLLASCSDDGTTKIWSMKSDKPLHTYQNDAKYQVFTLEWSPSGPGRATPSALATASLDGVVRIYETESDKCSCTLVGHREPVYAISFSPNARFIATGSNDRCLNIWSTQNGSLVYTYHASGPIFQLEWSPRGDKLAACVSDNTLKVLDVQNL